MIKLQITCTALYSNYISKYCNYITKIACSAKLWATDVYFLKKGSRNIWRPPKGWYIQYNPPNRYGMTIFLWDKTRFSTYKIALDCLTEQSSRKNLFESFLGLSMTKWIMHLSGISAVSKESSLSVGLSKIHILVVQSGNRKKSKQTFNFMKGHIWTLVSLAYTKKL